MGQIEVYEYLKNRRLSGDESFYGIAEITKALQERGVNNGSLYTIRGSLIRLEIAGYVEAKIVGPFRDRHRAFRLREEHLENPGKDNGS